VLTTYCGPILLKLCVSTTACPRPFSKWEKGNLAYKTFGRYKRAGIMGYKSLMPLDAVETLVEKALYPPPKDMQIFLTLDAIHVVVKSLTAWA
jgi:hypothetical protein